MRKSIAGFEFGFCSVTDVEDGDGAENVVVAVIAARCPPADQPQIPSLLTLPEVRIVLMASIASFSGIGESGVGDLMLSLLSVSLLASMSGCVSAQVYDNTQASKPRSLSHFAGMEPSFVEEM